MKHCILILALWALCACGNTSTMIENESPLHHTRITVKGSRTFTLDAWQVELKVEVTGFKADQLAFEVNAPALNDENVLFDWVDEEHCLITFVQSDDSKRIFHLTAGPYMLELTGE
jgi:hypothetical protein